LPEKMLIVHGMAKGDLVAPILDTALFRLVPIHQPVPACRQAGTSPAVPPCSPLTER
jgi:hypothetical protein